MSRSILIIDDNSRWSKSLAQNFEPRGYQVFSAVNRREAFDILARRPIHIVLLDIMLGEENGLDVLEEILLLYKDLPVIMITGFASVDTAVQSLKLGAFDYITKPLNFEDLLANMHKAIARAPRAEEISPGKPAGGQDRHRLITRNDTMLELCEKAKKFAATDFPILISGENGTGKEVLADFIHFHSSRHSHEMLKINCASFPETLLDNELFGHEKGAYTGADSIFKGVFERAEQGSLFLDEIGDMPMTIQAKILRTLQNHEIRRLGGKQTIKVNIRFLAATNKDLRQRIRENAFREDLLYRLEVATIHLPPLRERKDDISLLAERFLAEYSEMNGGPPHYLDKNVLALFAHHPWPGNVRELKNTIFYAATLSSGERIGPENLPSRFKQLAPQQRVANIREEMERELILKTLRRTRNNKKRAAELLKMSRTTLYNKLDRYGISPQTS